MNKWPISGSDFYFLPLLILFGLGIQGCEPGGLSRNGGSSTAEQALLAPPDYPNKKAAGWNRDGIDHLKREHWRKADADFGRALEEDPDFAEAHFNRGLALQAQGKEAEAREHFGHALEKDPGNPILSEHPALPADLK